MPMLTSPDLAIEAAIILAVAGAVFAGHGDRAAGTLSFTLAGAHAQHLPPGSFGYVNLVGAIMLCAFGSVGVAVGSKLTRRVDERVLRRLFAVLLVAGAGRLVTTA